MKWMGPVAYRGERINAYNILVQKCVGETPSGKPGHKWEDNMKMDTSVHRFWNLFAECAGTYDF